MSLFENLSEHDKDLISCYIDYFAYTDADDRSDSTKASLEYLLRYWNTNKEYLYNLFGQKFIIERPISLKFSVGEIAYLLNKEYSRASSPYCLFRQELRDLYIAGDTSMLKYSGKYRSLLHDIVEDTTALATNVYDGCRIDVPTPDGKTIVFERGCKPMRILGKVAKAYNMKTFEDFRIWHSQKLNQKALKGTLCLSIHPLDFMTMSDNECGWTSCMSWREEGCYRSGTVECMNSPLVLVAYLKSENGDMHIPGGSWNNKKWRSLFIVHDKVITNVKGYPYCSKNLNTIVLNWLLEMVPNNKRYGQIVEYDYVGPGIVPFSVSENTDPPQYNLEFVTNGHMYNDFGSEKHMGLFVHDEIPVYSNKRYGYSDVLIIDYSGESVCMHCGAVNDMPEDETELVCVDCSYEATCECCDCHVSREDYFIVDGRTLCCNCYYEHTLFDPITDERHYEYDMSKLYLVPEDSNVDEFTGDCHWDDLAYISVDEYTLSVNNLSASYPIYFVREGEIRCVRKWWSKWYYVRPSDLTPAGLKLFKSSIEDDHGYSGYKAYYQDAAEIIREGSK